MKDSFTSRGYTIAEFSLCSFGNIASIGIQIGKRELPITNEHLTK